jgi:hypothetical protein
MRLPRLVCETEAKRRMQSYFFEATAVLLFCAAVLNLLSAAGSAPVLNEPDALLQLNDKLALSNRWVLALKAAFELLVSGILLTGKKPRPKLVWMAWLATQLLVYRAGIRWLNAANFSDCVGNLIDWFTISPRQLGALSTVFLALMCLSSYGLLLLSWFEGRMSSRTEWVAGVDPQRV